MSKIVREVLGANQSYAQNFGKKGELACPGQGPSPFSPAWTRGSIRRKTRASRSATRMSHPQLRWARDRRRRPLAIPHKLLGAKECSSSATPIAAWSCSQMRSWQISSATASFNGKNQPAPQGPSRREPFHQMAHNQGSGTKCHAGHAAHPRASARAPQRARIRLRLRREDRSPERSMKTAIEAGKAAA